MEYRHARYVTETAIEMEVDHPVFGWVPFTATPDDVEPHGRKLFEAAKDTVAPYVAPPPPPAPPLPIVNDYEEAIQSDVDQAARGRQFRGGVTLASYVSSTIRQWSFETQAFIAWRDVVWAYAYQELAKVMAGEREQPTIEQIVAELPAIIWPIADADPQA